MRIGLGVCGGIAAYKAAELVRALQQDAYDVEVVMTAAAQQFVRPLTFAALTGHKVITGLWEGEPERGVGDRAHCGGAEDRGAGGGSGDGGCSGEVCARIGG